MRSRLLLLLVAALSIPLLSGCAVLSGAQAVATVYPVVRDAVDGEDEKQADGETARRAVADGGEQWESTIQTASGQPFRPDAYREGQTLQRRWRLPLTVGEGVEAIVALGRRSCDGRSPDRWTLRRVEGGSVGAAWRISDRLGGGVSSEADRRAVGAARAMSLAQSIRAAGMPRWLIEVPGSGQYQLEITYSAASPEAIMAARPCVSGWQPIDGQVAHTVLSGEGSPDNRRAAAPRRSERTDTTQRPPTSDIPGSATSRSSPASSASQGRPSLAGDASDKPRTETPSDASDEPPARWERRLMDIPTFDLYELHKLALEYEIASRDRRSAFRVQRARTLRRDRLQRLQQQGRSVVCQLAYREGVGNRGLDLWRGESTVPERLRSDCS